MMMSGEYDSVFTANKKHWLSMWDIDINPIDWEIHKRPRRQDKEEFYEEIGMYYITSKKRLLETGIRYSGKIGVVNIPSYDSLQIDSKEGLQFAERILNSI